MKTILLTLAALLAAPAVQAHVTLETAEAAPGSTYKAVLRIGHGCGAAATRELRVQIPEGVIAVKPMPKPGWTLETVTAAYGKSYDYYGSPLTEGVREIVWTGDLPDAWYDEFVFRVYLTPGLEAGQTVYFPTRQVCEGAEENWAQIPAAGQDPHALDAPAPGVKLVAAKGAEQHHAPAGQQVGDLVVSEGFSRATAPSAKVAGGFVTIANKGAAADRLISAEVDFAAEAQIHEMSMQGDVMKMRELPEGVEIPAGGTVELKSGGLHLMFLGLTRPLTEGETVPVTLTFEKAGKVTVPFAVLSPNAAGMEHRH